VIIKLKPISDAHLGLGICIVLFHFGIVIEEVPISRNTEKKISIQYNNSNLKTLPSLER
jgi:hypothetical protein